MLAGMSTDPATDNTPLLKLRTPADVVDAVPHLVGFQPENSFVCLSLRGPRKRLGLVSRVDLPPARYARQVAAETARHLKHDGADHVVAVFYPPDDGPQNGRLIALIDAFEKALDRRMLSLIEALCVYDGRWWSLLCDDDECCPPGGTPIDQQRTPLVAAEMAARGRVVFKSRAELEQTVAAVKGTAARDMRAELSRARRDIQSRLQAGERAEVAAESIKLYDEAVRSRQAVAERSSSLRPRDAARLIVALDDVLVRDQILGWAEGDRGVALQRLLAELAPLAVKGFDAPVLTSYALACYAQGDGALAGIAVERARNADPEYNLARIVDDALLRCLNPPVLRGWLRSMRDDLPDASSH
jgi:uncharacterized protein DUF4192